MIPEAGKKVRSVSASPIPAAMRSPLERRMWTARMLIAEYRSRDQMFLTSAVVVIRGMEPRVQSQHREEGERRSHVLIA